AAFSRAVELDPGLAVAHVDHSDMLNALGKYADAFAAADRALKLQPDLPEAHANRGLALARLGRPAQAVAAFDRAVELRPASPAVNQARGQALVSLSRFAEAAGAFREAVPHQKDFAEAYCGLGMVLQETGELTEALDALKRGHALGSKRPGWREPSKQWVSDCERLLALRKTLPALLPGEKKPADAAEAAWCA